MQRCYRLQLENWTIRLPGGVPNLLTPATLYTSVESYFVPTEIHHVTNVFVVETLGTAPRSSPLIMMLSTSAILFKHQSLYSQPLTTQSCTLRHRTLGCARHYGIKVPSMPIGHYRLGTDAIWLLLVCLSGYKADLVPTACSCLVRNLVDISNL